MTLITVVECRQSNKKRDDLSSVSRAVCYLLPATCKRFSLHVYTLNPEKVELCFSCPTRFGVAHKMMLSELRTRSLLQQGEPMMQIQKNVFPFCLHLCVLFSYTGPWEISYQNPYAYMCADWVWDWSMKFTEQSYDLTASSAEFWQAYQHIA